MNPFDKLADVFTAASEFVSDSPELAASAHNMSKGEIHELSGVSDQRALEVGYGYDVIKTNPVSYQFARRRAAQLATETPVQSNVYSRPQQQPAPAETLFDDGDLAYAAHTGEGFQGRDATVYDFAEGRRNRIRAGLSKAFNHEDQNAAEDRNAEIIALNPALYSNEVSDAGVEVTPEMVYNAGVLDQAPPAPAPAPEVTDSNVIDLAAVRAQINSTFDETGRTGAASFKVSA